MKRYTIDEEVFKLHDRFEYADQAKIKIQKVLLRA